MVFVLITASSQNYFIASLELFTAEIAFFKFESREKCGLFNIVYSPQNILSLERQDCTTAMIIILCPYVLILSAYLQQNVGVK